MSDRLREEFSLVSQFRGDGARGSLPMRIGFRERVVFVFSVTSRVLLTGLFSKPIVIGFAR